MDLQLDADCPTGVSLKTGEFQGPAESCRWDEGVSMSRQAPDSLCVLCVSPGTRGFLTQWTRPGRRKWWSWPGSNRRPHRCERCALPAELQPHTRDDEILSLASCGRAAPLPNNGSEHTYDFPDRSVGHPTCLVGIYSRYSQVAFLSDKSVRPTRSLVARRRRYDTNGCSRGI